MELIKTTNHKVFTQCNSEYEVSSWIVRYMCIKKREKKKLLEIVMNDPERIHASVILISVQSGAS